MDNTSDSLPPKSDLDMSIWGPRLSDARFRACLEVASSNQELIKEFDRLWGANLSGRGSVLDLMIDKASGRTLGDMAKFIDFVWEYIFIRIPLDCWDKESDNSGRN